nr:MAG TPA: hypothetical protein [Caudoviricetes sp.]
MFRYIAIIYLYVSISLFMINLRCEGLLYIYYTLI